MAENPKVQEWLGKCKPRLQPFTGLEKGEMWANMEEVFHQD